MLDKPEKAHELMEILDAAVPFEVGLMPDLIEYLARQQSPVAIKSIEIVSKVSYLGDVGGIICHIQPEDAESVVVVSLTHVRVRPQPSVVRLPWSETLRKEPYIP